MKMVQRLRLAEGFEGASLIVGEYPADGDRWISSNAYPSLEVVHKATRRAPISKRTRPVIFTLVLLG